MRKSLSLSNSLLIFGIPLSLIGLMVILTKTSAFKTHPSLSLGITLDLLFTVPLVYLLLIRKTAIPKTTAVPFLILGMVLCSVLLPVEQQSFLSFFKTWIFPIIELSIIAYIVYHLSKAIKLYKTHKNTSFDFFTTLKATCNEILPKRLVTPFVTEISIVYYGFLNWKKHLLKSNEFSYHKNSSSQVLLAALILIIGIETVTIHILLAKWSIIAAWVLTILSIYTGFQIFGFLRSFSKRPIYLENNTIYLRYGIMSEAEINIDNISNIELSSRDLEENKLYRKLSPLGQLEDHNVIIELKNTGTMTGLYGIQKEFKSIAFYIDEPKRFKDTLFMAMNQEA